MKTESTLIPPADAVPATALGTLERALAKCLDEAAEAFAASKGPPPPLDELGFEQDDGRGAQFGRAMALMKMTAKLGGVMAQLNSHRSQTHYVHRTEVRAVQAPPQARLPAAEDDPEPPYKFFDAQGNRRPLTKAEADRYNAWSSRHAERERLRIEAEEAAEQGAPSPSSSGSNSENHGPRIRLP